jgi:hypothetical protein
VKVDDRFSTLTATPLDLVMKYPDDIDDTKECLVCCARIRTFCTAMSRMQNVAKIDQFCVFEKLAIPALNAVKWIVGVGVEETSTTAGR